MRDVEIKISVYITLMILGILLTFCACATSIPTLADFIASDLAIGPGTVKPGEDVVVGVTLKNIGKQPGSHTVVVKVDGETVNTQEVTLAGGASKRVVFNVTLFLIGNIVISIGDLSGVVIVMDGG